jgi:hypothetical protein
VTLGINESKEWHYSKDCYAEFHTLFNFIPIVIICGGVCLAILSNIDLKLLSLSEKDLSLLKKLELSYIKGFIS